MYKDHTYHAMTLIDILYLAIESGYILTQSDIETLSKARKQALINLYDDMIQISSRDFEIDQALSELYQCVEYKIDDMSYCKDTERVVMRPAGRPMHFTVEQIKKAVRDSAEKENLC